MNKSPLLALPTELRLQIWELALLQSDQPVTIHENETRHRIRTEDVTFLGQAQALTRTCKQIHKECGSTFYDCNDFTIKAGVFFANVMLVRHLIPRLQAAGQKRERHQHQTLRVVLPSPLIQFDVGQREDGFMTRDRSRALMDRLTETLCQFQRLHPTIGVELHFPIRMWERATDIEFDFPVQLDLSDAAASIGNAMRELCQLPAGRLVLSLPSSYVGELSLLRRGLPGEYRRRERAME